LLGSLLAGALALVLASTGCGKKRAEEPSAAGGAQGAPAAAPAPERGDVLALLQPPGPLTEDLVQRLEALRIKELWILSGTLSGDGEEWRPAPPPVLKYRLPLGVFIVIRPSWQGRIAGNGAAGAGSVVATKLAAAAAGFREKGNDVRSAHVVFSDGEIPPADLGRFLSTVRKELTGKIDGPLSVTPPPSFFRSPEAAKALEAVDSVVPLLAGTPQQIEGEIVAKAPPAVELSRAESLGKPWLAGFWLAGGGLVLSSDGRTVAHELPESALDRVSEIGEIAFIPGTSLEDSQGYNYRLSPQRSANVQGIALAAGVETRFRGLTPTELVATVGELSRSAAKGCRGRIYFATDFPLADGSLGVEAIEEALAAKPLSPVPEIFVDETETATRRGGAVALTLRNASLNPSLLSQLNNWVELHVPSGSLASVDPGRFDRYEFWLGEGSSAKPVNQHRADRVRFFEFYLAPGEKVTSGPIRIAGDPSQITIRVSASILGADGSEISRTREEARATPPEPPSSAAPEGSAAGAPPNR
jgi:hypothetical protein